MRVSIISDKNKNSTNIKKILEKIINVSSLSKAQIIIVIGGDGFMLQTLKKNFKLNKPFYGLNSGNYGFLMNKFSRKNFLKNLTKLNEIVINPIQMKVKSKKNLIKNSIAINEIAILRQSRQAANLSIFNGKKKIITKLISDGVLVSTPAGSTAYNMSDQFSI